MKVYVCNICGEVYLGPEMPPNCPFCGVEAKNLRLGNAWEDMNIGVKPTEREKELLQEALKLELSNTSFYKCVSKTSTNVEVAKMFKGLSKVEAEHADVFVKLLKPEILPEVDEACEDDTEKILRTSLERETKATEFYAKALNESTTLRVKEVFEAIMKVEMTHIVLDKSAKERLVK